MAFSWGRKLRLPWPRAQGAGCALNHGRGVGLPPRLTIPRHLLSEDEMRHRGFEVPIDERERGQVERGMREHRDPDTSRDPEDGSEREPGDCGLLDAGKPLVRVVEQ